MANVETLTVTKRNTSLELLLHRRYRFLPDGYVESVFDLNPGLADFGVFLPLNTTVVAPIPERRMTAAEQTIINLWD